jgi:hypothetical protein
MPHSLQNNQIMLSPPDPSRSINIISNSYAISKKMQELWLAKKKKQVQHNKTTHCIATHIITRVVLLVAKSALGIVTKLGIIQHQISGITKADKQENLKTLNM